MPLSQTRSECESFENIRLFDIREAGQQLFDGAAAAIAPTIMPTVTRLPRMHSLPPMTSGSIVMRSNCSTSI
jgi:hypothetical protein